MLVLDNDFGQLFLMSSMGLYIVVLLAWQVAGVIMSLFMMRLWAGYAVCACVFAAVAVLVPKSLADITERVSSIKAVRFSIVNEARSLMLASCSEDGDVGN